MVKRYGLLQAALCGPAAPFMMPLFNPSQLIFPGSVPVGRKHQRPAPIEKGTSHKMIRVSVMYPNKDGAKFDLQYYRTTHMKLVRKHLTPHGLIKTGIDEGVSDTAGGAAPYICIGYLYFEDEETFRKAFDTAGKPLREDIPNFTNVRPQRQLSVMLED